MATCWDPLPTLWNEELKKQKGIKAGKLIAIDKKILCGNRQENKHPLHTVSAIRMAFASGIFIGWKRLIFRNLNKYFDNVRD